MYSPLIIKSEFRAYVKLGANVPKDGELDTYIRDFQQHKFEPTIPNNFYTDLIGDLTSKPELQSFLNDYIKPYLINGSYEQFLLWHGRNINQFGLRQNNEPESEAISDKARGELMADIRSRTNVCLAKMNSELSKANYKFDGVTYSFNGCESSRGKMNIGIKQVGRRRYNGY